MPSVAPQAPGVIASKAIDFKDRASRAMRLIGVRHPHFMIAWRKVRDLVKVDSKATRTFCVDSKARISINPTFAATLSPAEFGGVIVHELMHVALDHFQRAIALGIVSPDGKVIDAHGCEVHNVAGDWVINERIKRDGITLPKCAIYPPADYPSDRARTTEAFYYWIREQEQAGADPAGLQGGQGEGEQGDDPSDGADTGDQSSDQGDCAQPGGQTGKQGRKAPRKQIAQGCGPIAAPDQGASAGAGEGETQPGLSPEEIRQMAREIRASARQLGIGVGSSACLEALEPQAGRLPWAQLIRSGFETANAKRGQGRSTYARRSRRSGGAVIMPGRLAMDPKICFLIDASSSMDRAWIGRIVGEVERCGQIYGAPAYLIVHTDRVCWEGWITPGARERLTSAVKHEGGTRAAPAYRAMTDAGAFEVAVHFTDCEIENPWPECSARRLIVGAFGSGATRPYSEPPAGAELIPVTEGGAE